MKDQTLLLVQYNRAENNDIIEIFKGLTEEERTADRKAFFKSLHGLLEHIALGGVYFQKMLLPAFPELNSLATKYIDFKSEYGKVNLPEVTQLIDLVHSVDDSFVEIVRQLTEEELNRVITVNTPRSTLEQPVWFLLNGFVNHGTHHRGQIMQILEEMNIDANFGMLKLSYDEV